MASTELITEQTNLLLLLQLNPIYKPTFCYNLIPSINQPYVNVTTQSHL